MHDVIVLGAGVAGLAAAAALTKAGLDVCVVEAQNRVGGRVKTLHAPHTSIPIELGAEFAHGEAKVTRAIANDAHIPFVDIVGTHWLSRGDAMEPSRNFGAKLEAVMGKVAKRVETGADKSFAEALRGTRLSLRDRALGLSFVEGFNAASADRISARSLGMDGGEGHSEERSARTLHGYDAIPSFLASTLSHGSLRLSTIATSVHWRKSDVRVTCRTPTGNALAPLRARKLVVTLPLSILAASFAENGAGNKHRNDAQSAAIRFEPTLPSKANAVSKLAMGNVLRLTLRFRNPFWTVPRNVKSHHHDELKRLSFIHAPNAPIMTWWTPYPIEAPLLIGWAGGPAADALLALGQLQIIERALDSLAHAFGAPRGVIDEMFDGAFFHDWAADPFARGAYSYPLVGGARAATRLAAPVDHTLFFAGEATELSPDNGTVHGAISSGQRAAREILATQD